MSTIKKEFTTTVSPERVFSALTQQDEIARWWTDDLSVKPEAGSPAEFRFRQRAFVLQLEIAELDANKTVSWLSRQNPAGWSNTRVTWQLTPTANGGTELVFTHDGFVPGSPEAQQVNGIWEYFLGSLKSYLETGQGTPGLPATR